VAKKCNRSTPMWSGLPKIRRSPGCSLGSLCHGKQTSSHHEYFDNKKHVKCYLTMSNGAKLNVQFISSVNTKINTVYKRASEAVRNIVISTMSTRQCQDSVFINGYSLV
jgi:hypothetical protein